MREFSKVYHNVWTSQKFESLGSDNSDFKLLYLFILSGQHSNSSGCYNLKPGYVMADLNWTDIRYRKAIDSLSRVGLIETEDDLPTVLITKWTEFNEPTNAKHAIGVFAHLAAAASLRLKHKRGQEFTAIVDRKKYTSDRLCGTSLDTLCQPYRYPIDSLSSPRPDRDQRPETRPDRDLDQTGDLKSRARETPPPVALATLTGGATSAPGEQPEAQPQVVSPLLQTNYLKRVKP